ncbi:MAG: hypothetical protein QOH79_3107 [Acidimicrobiaceae bacterium]
MVAGGSVMGGAVVAVVVVVLVLVVVVLVVVVDVDDVGPELWPAATGLEGDDPQATRTPTTAVSTNLFARRLIVSSVPLVVSGDPAHRHGGRCAGARRVASERPCRVAADLEQLRDREHGVRETADRVSAPLTRGQRGWPVAVRVRS